MIEREILVSPNGDGRPDILKKPFSPDIHPYTMMFLYLAYEEGAHKKLPGQHIKVFDDYFTGDDTIKDEKDEKFKRDREIIIRNGFKILRKNSSDRLNQFFNENRLPFFKIGDNLFVNDSDIELKKHKFSNQSMKMMGSKLSEEHKRNIGIKMKGRIFSEETREKFRQAKLGTKQSAEVVANRIAKVKKKWAEDEEFRRRMQIIRDARKKAKKKDLE